MSSIELDRLERLKRWGSVSPWDRTEEWIREFERAFWPALLFDRDHILYGNQDANPYRFIGFQPESADTLPGLGGQVVRPAALVDDLIAKGQGLIFGQSEAEPICVFRLGEILSYRLYGRALAILPPPSEEPAVLLPQGATVMLSPASPDHFPEPVRINVRRHLQNALGIREPRALWVRFPNGRSGLGFDFEPERVEDEGRLRRAFDALSWFLPARLTPYFRVDALAQHPEMQPF